MRRLLIGLVAMLSLGCTEINVEGSANLNGTYTLRSVNGQSLPYTVSSSGTTKVERLDDAISLYSGGTWSSTGHIRTTTNGTAVTQAVNLTGPFTSFGTSLSLRVNETGGTTVAVYSANTLTIIESGLTSIYSR